MSKDEIKLYLNEVVDWSISINGTLGDKIIDCYLFNTESVSAFIKISNNWGRFK